MLVPAQGCGMICISSENLRAQVHRLRVCTAGIWSPRSRISQYLVKDNTLEKYPTVQSKLSPSQFYSLIVDNAHGFAANCCSRAPSSLNHVMMCGRVVGMNKYLYLVLPQHLPHSHQARDIPPLKCHFGIRGLMFDGD
jgi:hypothetical protein